MNFISGTALSHLGLPRWILAPPSWYHDRCEMPAKQHMIQPAGLFGNLPSKLLSDITKILDLDDVACLALTCQRMRHFNFPSLQMVMDEYQATGSTAAVDGLRVTYIKDRVAEGGAWHKVLTSIDLKVIDDALFMRVQEVIGVDIRTACNMNGPFASITLEKFSRLNTCAHGGNFAPFSGFLIWRAFYSGVLSITPPDREPNTREQSSLCNICGMAGTRKLMKLEDGGEAYAMIRWIRLGTGKPFDSGDATWIPMFGQILSFAPGDPRLASNVPDWRMMYEHDEKLSWNELLDGNLKLLGHTN